MDQPNRTDWDDFPSACYFAHNYLDLKTEDQEVLSILGPFFARSFAEQGPVEYAIDVGTGTNLYPAMLMLPWTRKLLLADHSAGNVAWLRSAIAEDGSVWTWQPFWDQLSGFPGYDEIRQPRTELQVACEEARGKAGIQQRSVFELPRAEWQLGTMFFVAESITHERGEFEAVLSGFLGALQPGAPFAAAFMADSEKYVVDGRMYPAFAVTVDDVTAGLASLGARELEVCPLKARPEIRDGYSGMIVAMGRADGRS